MIVFDLQCKNSHVFEVWFSNSAAFEEQRKKKLVACPYCDSTTVKKAPMAARVPAKGNRKAESLPVASGAERPEAAQMLEKLATMQREALKSSEWVGRDFDANARAMDAGEIPHRSIHGEVSKQEAKELIEDGIKVMPLPFPVIPPDKAN